VPAAASSAQKGISDAKDAALSNVAEAGAAQVSAVGTTGADAVEGVNDAKTAALGEIDAANAALPSPTQSDAGKVPTVKADGSAYELAGPYAPLSAAIRPTASGNPVNITDSVEWPLQGLKVYGKSTQDGTPSPESPVPIVSAGDDGSIDLTVSNGASLSQSMTISTPNGLPGIPVDSDGNYTDAEGQQWICNEVDFARGVYVQRVKLFEVTRELNIASMRPYNTVTFNGGYWPFRVDAWTGEIIKGSIAMCNNFQFGSSWSAKAEL